VKCKQRVYGRCKRYTDNCRTRVHRVGRAPKTKLSRPIGAGRWVSACAHELNPLASYSKHKFYGIIDTSYGPAKTYALQNVCVCLSDTDCEHIGYPISTNTRAEQKLIAKIVYTPCIEAMRQWTWRIHGRCTQGAPVQKCALVK
jgi:hypothetical protein